MNYEIQIGYIIDISSGQVTPKQTMNISEEQFRALEQFANITKDEDLNLIYKINDCVFKIVPKLFAQSPKEEARPALVEKPPLVLEPRKYFIWKRIVDISNAVARYTEVNKMIPEVWTKEYNELCAEYSKL